MIYRIDCRRCPKYYMGSTQNKLKVRLAGHLQDVRRSYNLNESATTLSSHFADHLRCQPVGEGNVSAGDARTMMKASVAWHGNIISCMKAFGTPACRLCLREKLVIWREWRKNPGKVNKSTNGTLCELFSSTRIPPVHTGRPALMTLYQQKQSDVSYSCC